MQSQRKCYAGTGGVEATGQVAAMHVASGWAQTTTPAARTASTGTPARATMASVSMPRNVPLSDLPLAKSAVSTCDERGDCHQPGLQRHKQSRPGLPQEFIIGTLMHMIHGQVLVLSSLAVALSCQQASSPGHRKSQRQII